MFSFLVALIHKRECRFRRWLVADFATNQTDKKLKLLLHRAFVVCASWQIVQGGTGDRPVSLTYEWAS
ncbi:hypothetical protein H6F86_24740 [Phormidium sp. FACHB-592]|uniref:Transposase n=1 Tax=Stenomitos frigidus AS-A4 TaxID=2933935 RepID=A0ABV0KUL7_9CYAN|nr:hypothetical protein [Phormidium sp. FACHB-592]MBD2077036.1 hypothetical protein [Phormidium sp. FACHB-592]